MFVISWITRAIPPLLFQNMKQCSIINTDLDPGLIYDRKVNRLRVGLAY